MLLGLGIDVLSLARLEAVVQRRGAMRIAQRICCERELTEFRELPTNDRTMNGHISTAARSGDVLLVRQLRFLSARWAAKEAAYKAIPSKVAWKDLDLRYASSGRPILNLNKPTPHKHLENISLLATISHDAGVIVAAVVAQSNSAASDS